MAETAILRVLNSGRGRHMVMVPVPAGPSGQVTREEVNPSLPVVFVVRTLEVGLAPGIQQLRHLFHGDLPKVHPAILLPS